MGEGVLWSNIGGLMWKYRAGLKEFQNYTWGGTVLRVKKKERSKFERDRASYEQEVGPKHVERNCLRGR